MIVEMKKVALVMLDSKRDTALESLKELGVVHLDEIKGKGPVFEALEEKRSLVERALNLLPLEKKSKAVLPASIEETRALETASRIIRTFEERKNLQEEADKILREKERISPWGDFEPGDIEVCARGGVRIILYEVSTKALKQIPEGLHYFTVRVSKNTTLIALVSTPGSMSPESLPAVEMKEFPLPQKSLSQLEEEAEEIDRKIDVLEREIFRLSEERNYLTAYLLDISERIEFEAVRSGMEEEGRLSYLSGFVPVHAVDALKEAAVRHGWGLLVQEPEPEDTVPTLLQNPPSVRIIQPIFSMLGTIPGYWERDTSLVFLIFFTIFTAMIIGDAGYGLIYLLGSLYFGRKKQKEDGRVPDILKLAILLSSFTIVWGAITGNYFGSEALSKLKPFSLFIIPSLYNFSPESSAHVQFICFILGTIHLSIAHIWNFLREVRQKPLLRSFAQLGWLSLILGLYFFVLNIVLDAERFPIPSFSIPMVLGGVAFVFIFSQQDGGNFLKGVLKGLAGFLPTILSSVSAFSDIISYIRLFAVGLAGVEIAKNFNGMAASLGSTVVGIVAGLLVFVAGHGLNILMSILSVIVHGIRLNMLEFSGHLGMEWSGVSYKPFAGRRKTE